MPNLKDALSRLLTIPGVRATVLVGRDGLPIESAGRGNGRFHEDVGALGASAIATTEALGQTLGAGHTVAVLLEYEDVLVSVDPLSEYVVLVTLAESAASLGLIRHTLHANRHEILRLLDMH